MSDEFTCNMCHQTFDKGWSDDEARAERLELFGEWKDEECELVCDDCFQKIKLISYEELRAKARKDMADWYRKLRKDGFGAIAKLYWKIKKNLLRQ